MSSNQFHHSVKVPRLYKEASKVIKSVNDGGSLKSLITSANHPNKKGLNALVLKTMQHQKIIDKIFESSKIMEKEERMDKILASVLTTELLWGKKSLRGEAKPILTILKYQDEFSIQIKDEEFQNLYNDSLDTIWRPRYVRVNTLFSSVEDVIRYFTPAWKLLSTPSQYSEYIKLIESDLKDINYIQDIHIKELLAFPFGTVFEKNPLYHNGTLVLQDKASCMVTHVLAPESGSTILDMCAAPGMKTTHLAAYMNNVGHIYAVEKDATRYKVLQNNVKLCKATCVKTMNIDSFSVTNKTIPDVDYILLDPSCSGSGMISRMDYDRENTDSDRLHRLANLQAKMLRFALTQFPTVKRVVYSTCSIHEIENEGVIEDVLSSTGEFRLIDCTKVFSTWSKSGSLKYSCGSKCIRTNPENDYTNGFFIAAFERSANASDEKEFVPKSGIKRKRHSSVTCKMLNEHRTK